MDCTCGKPTAYGKECQDCYEDRQRREAHTAWYYHGAAMQQRAQEKERCTERFIFGKERQR